jgi:hypothetical protein
LMLTIASKSVSCERAPAAKNRPETRTGRTFDDAGVPERTRHLDARHEPFLATAFGEHAALRLAGIAWYEWAIGPIGGNDAERV